MTGASDVGAMLDTVPVTGVCDTHGNWSLNIPAFLAGKAPTRCPSCAKAAREAEEERQREAEKAKRAERDKQVRIDRLQKAGVGLRHMGKTFDAFVANTKELREALALCRSLSESVIAGEPSAPSLIMIGNTGTGKSHLGCAITVATSDAGKDVRRIQASELIRNIKAAWAPKAAYTEQEAIDHYGYMDLLVLEEIGVQFGSDTERLYLFEVVNKRYEACLPTVLISNLDMERLTSEVGERVVDRLREDGGRLLTFTGKSWRAS